MIEKKEREITWVKKLLFHEKKQQEITDSMKRPNVRIISIPKGVVKERGLEEIFEQIVAENFSNLARETSIHVQEAQRTPSQDQ